MSNKINTASTSLTEKVPRRRTVFLKRYILEPDDHDFIGRVYDLGIIKLHFDTYEEMVKYPDCKYVYDVELKLTTMVNRIESLNMVGDMLWLEELFINQVKFPVSKFQWLNITADTFLMRFVSVFDCSLLLVNEVLELGFEPRRCSLKNFRKRQIPQDLIVALKKLEKVSSLLKIERNERFHRGLERLYTSDDETFRSISWYELNGRGMTGEDVYGREIDNEKFFREGLVNLQRDFNSENKKLLKCLNALYNVLFCEFEKRFSQKYNDPITGYGIKQ